jgi:hypothetical protein
MATKKNAAPKRAAKRAPADDLQTQLEAQARSNAALVAQLATLVPSYAGPDAALYVGVRNISNYTISRKSPFQGQPDINLHVDAEGRVDPNSVAVVNYAWWQQLRKDAKLYGAGMIVRDDTILGNGYRAAPADRPEDCHPDWAKNAVLDVREFIENQTEAQMRARIEVMTSEPSLRRISAACFLRTQGELEKLPAGTPKALAVAKSRRPMTYQMAEMLVETRLLELAGHSRRA